MSKVLMFHRVLPRHLISEMSAYATFGTLISQEFFEKILQLIEDHCFKTKTVSEIAAQPDRDEDKSIALTFDDGYSDNFEFALPLLKKYNANATFYPVVIPCRDNTVLPLDTYYQSVEILNLTEAEREEYIKGDTKKRFYWAEPIKQHSLLKTLFQHIPNTPQVSYMTAHQLKALSLDGFEIGSHGMTHSLLSADYMTEQKRKYEIQDSKQWLEHITGKPVFSFCFPAGRYNKESIDIAKGVGYKSTSLVYRDENVTESLPSFERFFVKPDSLQDLKSYLKVL